MPAYAGLVSIGMMDSQRDAERFAAEEGMKIDPACMPLTNAISESMNSKIQKIKARACGYRNRERFKNAIMFHLGGLDLYPAGLSTHSNP